MRASLILSAAAAALAVLAGCGSSKSTSSATTNSTSSATTAAGSTATTQTSAPSNASGGGSAYGSKAAGAQAATGQAVVVTTKHGSAGTVLAVGPKRMTVYLFEADRGPASSCSGACASAWPPVTTAAAVTATGGATKAKLATITRPDGTKQVTYNGHPLYFFAMDKDQGDSYGQGVKAFGASWYVLAPSGNKVDNS